MKKMIINCGLTPKKGTLSDDSGNLSEYFELGWEMVGSRMDVIRWLNEGKITKDHTILTSEDRKFMYSNIFDNVSSDMSLIGDSLNLAGWPNPARHTFQFYNNETFSDSLNSKYKHLKKDKLLLETFDYSDVDILPTNKFVGLCLRYRNHLSYRNAKEEYWEEVMKEYSRLGYTVYVVGAGSEKYDGFLDNNVIHINKLKNWAFISSHKLCKGILGSGTGTKLVAYFSARNGVPISTIDDNGLERNNQNNAILGGPCVAFKDSCYTIRVGKESNIIPKELVSHTINKEDGMFEWDYYNYDTNHSWRFNNENRSI